MKEESKIETHRMGKIKISNALLNTKDKALNQLFNVFIPVHINFEERYSFGQLVYTGYCELFDEISIADELPTYIAIFNNLKGKVVLSCIELVEELSVTGFASSNEWICGHCHAYFKRMEYFDEHMTLQHGEQKKDS